MVQSWSLSSEALGYLLFPGMVLVATRATSRNVCHAFALGSLAAFCCMIFTGHVGVVRMLLTFPVGIALARAYHIKPLGSVATRRLSLLSCAIIVISLTVDRLAPLSVFGFAGLIYTLATGGSAAERLLSSRPVMFLGKISFSLYLTHHVLFMFLSWVGGAAPAWLAFMVGASFCVAVGTYNLVEAPSHRYGRRIAGERVKPDIPDRRVLESAERAA